MFVRVTQRRISATGLLFALLALTAQLAFGAIVPRPEVALVLQGTGVICHAPPPPGAPAQPIHHHTNPDSLLCPLCSALTTPCVVLLGTGVALPPPQLVAFHRPGLPPPATAPPASPRSTAQPRGPPVLV
jgi:hypothetical protein